MADEMAPDFTANGEDTQPQIGMIAQYVKDFSFENPNAPNVYSWAAQPQIDVQFNLATSQIGEDVHETTLKIDITAEGAEGVAFRLELLYGGLFGIRNVPPEAVQPFLLGEAPRLLFPFARRVVADAVRDGGFPPLMLDPIDFNGLYFQQLEQQQAAMGTPAGEA
ncbi:protein-export chaperone SecB [Sphingomonas morindae]|uniref:Protein-export protein SecB n=1 Tax=Sphingomonas morindae TaxID=1541170 RepID=A0ABY4XAU2_9SPHN|nr:protein-export chaperone SecB [Sphingomonas morindae]USI73954.1 protein-export chaperone SecB [Sphingomonas morindae]